MNIVLADDGRALDGGNINQILCTRLKRRGHKVAIFDGRDENDQPIKDPQRVALRLGQVVTEHEATGMVLDLHWFGDFEFGEAMLKELKTKKFIPRNMKIFIFSRFVTSARIEPIHKTSGIPRDRIVQRFTHTIDDIVELFAEEENEDQ